MAKRLRNWLQKRLHKSKIFYPSDYGILLSGSGGSGPSPSPSAFADIWGWWRADTFTGSSGSYVLTDKSANGRNMTQAAGTLTAGTAANGQARFTGNATARLTSSATLENWPITVFTIGRRTNNATCGFFGHTGASGFGTLWYGYEASNAFNIYNTSTTANTTSEADADACWVARIGYGSRVPIVNGLLQAVQTLPSVVRSSAITVTIGTEYRGLNMDWQETLVWNRNLSLTEIDEVHAYINTRYGMSIPLWSSYTPVDAIWMGGQSNMAGRGDRGASDVNIPAEYDAALTGANVWYGVPSANIGTAWDTLNINNENHHLGDSLTGFIGPEVTCGKEYIDRTGTPVYIMKWAQGSSFLHFDSTATTWWDPLSNSAVSNHANRMYSYSPRNWWLSLRIHQQNSRRPVGKGLLWYQGENDATVQAYANVYQTRLTGFFNTLRPELGVGNMKAYIIRIHSGIDIGQHPYRDTVRAAQDAFCADPSNNAELVSVDSYTLRDSAHINVAGQLALGTYLAGRL